MFNFPYFSQKFDRFFFFFNSKRRTLHVPNLMQMDENNRFFSFALNSTYVKFDVWNGPQSQRKSNVIAIVFLKQRSVCIIK